MEWEKKKGRAKEEKVRIKTILPQIFELNFPFYSLFVEMNFFLSFISIFFFTSIHLHPLNSYI